MAFTLSQNPSKLITRTSEQDFKNALEQGSRTEIIELPKITPKRLYAGLGPRTSQLTDVARTAPLFNDPRYTSSTLAIPVDSRTLNGLYRFFTETDPIVGSALRLHAELPLAELQIGACEDSLIQQHFEDMWERINGLKLLTDIVSEYYEIGSVTSFGAWNEADYMWDQFAILNPDFVKIESTWVNQNPLIKLIPDDVLKKVVRTQSPRFLYEQIPSEIIRYVMFGQEIPLDANNTFLISHAKRPYETHGRSLIKRILKILMLEDRLNQANFALATRHMVPFTVVKVGDPAGNWLPQDEDLEAVRDAVSAWEMDPNFCYDKETECLTKEGWKKYTELTLDTEIACFDPKVEAVVYDKPSYINIQDYDGEMYYFNRRGIDLKVTPNHRMLVKRENKWQIVQARQVGGEDKVKTAFEKDNTVVVRGTYKVGNSINKIFYKGKIWCPTVKTGIIVTRRNGKIAIQGQSLVWHYGIDVQFYGASGRTLPVGPELDRIYRLKFIGLNVHEQLLAGAGGTYASAYINLEVQRQRYLNLQLKLETFVHQGMFKPVADLCGFYRIRQPVAGYGGVTSTSYGKQDFSQKEVLKQSTTLRDYQDNKEFVEFSKRKLAERDNQVFHQTREYIYPKLDWGGMSAASDENLKNYIKWLSKERPWLVDDATLARLARLDRDDQEKTYVKDLERAQKRYLEISKAGLLPFALQKGKGAEPVDFGGIGDIGVGPIGGPSPEAIGGEPGAPVGVGGPPETATGEVPPQMPAAASSLEKEIQKQVFGEDSILNTETKQLLRNRSKQDTAVVKRKIVK